MTRNIITSIVIPLASFAMLACGSGQSTSVTNTPNLGALEDQQTNVLTKYDGSYQTFCGMSAFAPLSSTSVTVTTIDGAQGSITTYNYSDRGCTVPAVPAQTVMNVSLSYPGGTLETDRGTADFIDITVDSITLDGASPSLVEQQQLAAANVLSNRFDIIVLQDSALYTGENTETMNASSEETRPTTLNTQPAIAQ